MCRPAEAASLGGDGGGTARRGGQGTLIAMARLNRPSLMVYGGTIRPGFSKLDGATLDIVSAFQSYGQAVAGKVTEEQRFDIVRNSCPGAGACGGMYTANTMASAIEALGMTLPYSSSIPAEDPLKRDECRASGRAIHNLLTLDLKPRDIMTRAAFENAMVVVTALGGSTNAVLHLIAMAHACGITLTLEDFQRVSDRTPFLADLKPSGKCAPAPPNMPRPPAPPRRAAECHTAGDAAAGVTARPGDCAEPG